MAFGGSEDDRCSDIAADPDGTVRILGGTRSTDFPVHAGASQPALSEHPDETEAPFDYFVAHVDPFAQRILAATYVGGRDVEGDGASLALDEDGRPVILGHS
jgi:hypothetical protein